MTRTQTEREYWDRAAQDPEVDVKYIADVPTELCLQDLGKMKGEVLEIGCGVGRLLQPNYYGIDISTRMLNIANSRNPNMYLAHTDGRTIPFTDHKFDYVYSYLVFQHLPKDAVQGYIKEAHRVLKPGGTLIFQWIMGNEDEPFSKHLAMEDVREMTKDFKSVTSKPSLAHTSWIITRCKK